MFKFAHAKQQAGAWRWLLTLILANFCWFAGAPTPLIQAATIVTSLETAGYAGLDPSTAIASDSRPIVCPPALPDRPSDCADEEGVASQAATVQAAQSQQ